MKRVLLVISCFYCLFLSFPLNAQSNNYYVAIKGGVSLGSYESGLNWVLMNYINKKENGDRLVSISGASAGSVNSLLSAAKFCHPESDSAPLENGFFETWNIDVNNLLVDDESKNDTDDEPDDKASTDPEIKYEPDRAVFNRKQLRRKVRALKDKIRGQPASRDCSLVITMSVTSFKPYQSPVEGTGHNILFQRFVVPLLVTAKKGELIKFRNIYDITTINRPDRMPSVYIHLPEDKDGTIRFRRIKNLAFASSAFPVAFSPINLEYCLSTSLTGEGKCAGDNAVVSKFSDGGLFDNSPIGVALDIQERKFVFCGLERGGAVANKDCGTKASSNRKDIIFYINPDNYRVSSKKEETGNEESLIKPSGAGIIEYGSYFYDSFTNATSFELQKSLLEIEEKDKSEIEMYTTSRFHHLLADFHAHFGAFYLEVFRKHDYLVGIYDGYSNLAALNCRNSHYSDYCREQMIKDRINALPGKSEADKENKLFLTYLFHDEFGQPNDSKVEDKVFGIETGRENDYYKNRYIVLNLAFKRSEKTAGVTHHPGEVEFGDYIQSIRYLSTDSPFEKVDFDAKTRRFFNNYDKWQSEKLRYALNNVTTMQSCTNCAESNRPVGEFLARADTVIDSMLVQMDQKSWPLSIDFTTESPLTFGIDYGFNFFEPSQIYGIKTRYPFYGTRYSLDAELFYHELGSERADDDYRSLSIGVAYHIGGGSGLFMPTIGVGLEHSEATDLYTHQDTSIYFSASFLSEIVSLRIGWRGDDVQNYQDRKIRDNAQLLLTLELGRVAKILFK